MVTVIVVLVIIFLLLKWFIWKLKATALAYHMVKNNIEISDEQLKDATEATLYHWLKRDKTGRNQ